MKTKERLDTLTRNQINAPILREMLISGKKNQCIISINYLVTLLTKQIVILEKMKKGLLDEIKKDESVSKQTTKSSVL